MGLIDLAIEEIKADFYKRWVSDDGLARLTPWSGEGPNANDNENGILFLMYFYLLCDERRAFSGADKNHLRAAESGIRTETPGLYNRHHGETWRAEAHDNPGAIACGAVYAAEPWAMEIALYGERHGWLVENRLGQDPNLPDIKQQRQGGEAAYVKMCAFWTPTPWELLWFVGGVIVNSVKNNDSNTLLTWMRFHAIMHIKVQDTMPAWVRALTTAAFLVFNAMLDSKGGIGPVVERYFQEPDHPCRKLVRLPR